MPKRPPADPLPRGLVWREATVDTLRADDPLAEWAYVTPRHPDGLPGSELRRVGPAHRLEVMRFWMVSNFEPLPPGPWFGFGATGHGFGQGVWAPPTWPPEEILSDEFRETAPAEDIAKLSDEFAMRAQFWTPLTDRPLDLVLNHQVPASLTTVQATLERLEAAVAAFQKNSGGIGHNGGPEIVDKADLASIREAAAEAKVATAEGKAGAGRVAGLIARLKALARGMAPWIGVAGLIDKVSELDWSDITKAAINLFHATLEAATALQNWLSSLL
jgi:hypothetical protein